MCRDETRRGRTRSPLAAGRNQTKVTTKANMKPKEKAEGESQRRRPRQEEDQRSRMTACHRQIRSDGKACEEAKILRMRIPRNRRRNPATTGTLFRSHLVWALRPCDGLHAGRSTPLLKVVLRRGIPSMREDPRAVRHHGTLTRRICVFGL